ncbi:MAG: hypothetical protein MZU97_09260 [Bacillus subtilis]|nr:hypothetical protein [Bacillus subtilis]
MKNIDFTQINDNFSRVKSIESLAFELELLDDKAFADFLQGENFDILAQMPDFTGKLDPNLLNNLQNLALKDKIPFSKKDISDIRILIYSYDLMGRQDNIRIKIDSLDEKDMDFLKQIKGKSKYIIKFGKCSKPKY